MGVIQNKLPEVMARHRIKQAPLAEAAGLRYATLNALYNGKTERLDLTTLAAVLDGLNSLTGKLYDVGDVFTYDPMPAKPTPGQDGNKQTSLLEASAVELRSQLSQLEQDTPKEELDAWLNSFEARS